RVPEDISLVGFDDIPLASYTSPPLTSVRMSANDVGSTAFDALFRLIGGERLEGDVYQVPTQLVVRQSTARPRHCRRLREDAARSGGRAFTRLTRAPRRGPAQPNNPSTASGGRSASDQTNTSAASDTRRITPTPFIPARRAPSIPAAASSTTMQRAGITPRRAAAVRNTWGSAFPAVTSSAVTTASESRAMPS